MRVTTQVKIIDRDCYCPPNNKQQDPPTLRFFKSSKLSLQKGEERETQMVMNSLITGVVSYFAFVLRITGSISKAETVTSNTHRHRQLQTAPTAKVTAFLIIQVCMQSSSFTLLFHFPHCVQLVTIHNTSFHPNPNPIQFRKLRPFRSTFLIILTMFYL